MVTKYGMSDKLGTITLGSGDQEIFLGRDIAQHKDYSEETFRLIDEEVKSIIDKAHDMARKILKEHYDKLEAVANVLMEKEKISGDEFDRIIDGIPANDAE